MGSEIKSLEHPTLKVSKYIDNNMQVMEYQAVLLVKMELFFVLKIFIDNRNFYRFKFNDKFL